MHFSNLDFFVVVLYEVTQEKMGSNDINMSHSQWDKLLCCVSRNKFGEQSDRV